MSTRRKHKIFFHVYELVQTKRLALISVKKFACSLQVYKDALKKINGKYLFKKFLGNICTKSLFFSQKYFPIADKSIYSHSINHSFSEIIIVVL